MKFALLVSALGSLVFALAVAGVYEITGGLTAVVATWTLKVAIGVVNIRIGHAKSRHETRKLDGEARTVLRAVA